jgi:hypothetical protein
LGLANGCTSADESVSAQTILNFVFENLKNMKQFILLFVCSVSFLIMHAQPIGIGTTQPDPNAVLDVYSADKGMLIPRMDSSKRMAMNASKGMIVFDTTTGCTWQYNGLQWINTLSAAQQSGALAYWNGQSWQALAPGQPGQYLTVQDGSNLPTWSAFRISLDNISTAQVSNINPTTASTGGFIQNDGGLPVLERGVVWSTSQNPTVSLTTKTSDGSGIGSFSSSLTGLNTNTTYYVRAYARNANGVFYGNQVSFLTGGNFSIGQTYGGGKIFYIDATGQHGLIVSPEDLTTSVNYDTDGSTGTGTTTGASAIALGTGSTNTNNLITRYGSTQFHAASFCKLFYNGGGFTDWYLPSLMELRELYNQRNVVGGLLNFSSYWSSSEIDAFNAWTINFGTATYVAVRTNKSNNAALRAVRSF